MAILIVCWPVKLTWYNKEINCIGSFWSKKLHSGPDFQKNCIRSLIKCSCPGSRIWTLLYPWSLQVTNNLISLCQSRILRIPAVSTGCDRKKVLFNTCCVIVTFACDHSSRWEIFVASLKLWNGNQKTCQWQHSW